MNKRKRKKFEKKLKHKKYQLIETTDRVINDDGTVDLLITTVHNGTLKVHRYIRLTNIKPLTSKYNYDSSDENTDVANSDHEIEISFKPLPLHPLLNALVGSFYMEPKIKEYYGVLNGNGELVRHEQETEEKSVWTAKEEVIDCVRV